VTDKKHSRNRLQRVMKAQEKPGAQAGQGTVKDKKTNAVAEKRGPAAKKRKVDVKEEPKIQGEEDDGKDAKQLHQSLTSFNEEGEKV
jgi:hypothetical protein